MNLSCLHCYQALSGGEKDYHLACARKVFGVSWAPIVNFTIQDFPIIAQEMAGNMSISGVQPKISVQLNKKTKSVEKAPAGGAFILKPQNDRFPNLPENEDLVMSLATLNQIEVPPHTLVRLKDQSLAYLVKRFDRKNDGLKLHQEDFTQILNIKNKYSGSYEQIGKGILEYCTSNFLELTFYFERILFCFVVGNGDMHAKNFSLLRNERDEIVLSPAYDLLSSKLVIPNEQDLALTLNGKQNSIRRSDFFSIGENLNIDPATIEKSIKKIIALKEDFAELTDKSFLPSNQKEQFKEMMAERCQRIKA